MTLNLFQIQEHGQELAKLRSQTITSHKTSTLIANSLCAFLLTGTILGAISLSFLYTAILEAMQKSSLTNMWFAGLALSLILFLCYSAFYLSRYLTKPIAQLTSASETFADNNYIETVDVQATGELGILIKRFNEMADHVNNAIKERDMSIIKLKRNVKQAKEVTTAKSQFLTHMSHEIRTPMNGILGMAELLERDETEPSKKRRLQSLLTSGKHLLEVINDILDLSRIEAGHLTLNKQTFDIQDFLSDIFELLGRSAHNKGVELFYYIGENVPDTLYGDPLRLRQVLINLIGNAVKFTENGRVYLNVTCPERNGHKARLHFEVHDTGIGIRNNNLSQLFQAFQQSDSSISQHYGGTGLGLAISKQLVEMMDGNITVESSFGKGSVFKFQALLDVQDYYKTSDEHEAHILKDKKVIVAQKDPLSIKSTCQYLKRWNMHPIPVSTGEEVIKFIKKGLATSKECSLVIIDDTLPDITGRELVTLIAHSINLTQDKSLPIILLTNLEENNTNQDGPLFHQLIKPYSPRNFLKTIHESLQKNTTPALPKTIEKTAKPYSQKFKAHILVAEDNPINQELAYELLTELGCQVDLADNGLVALKSVQRNDYDLIFMDWQMPAMDGLESTHRIRQHEKSNKKEPVPIIALTANAIAGDRDKCLTSGMDDYLSKPFTASDLHRMLDKYLKATHTALVTPKPCNHKPEQHYTGNSQNSPLDKAALDPFRNKVAMRGGMMIDRLITQYLRTSNLDMKSLSDAVFQKDFVAIGLTAHKMKSSGAALGANILANLLKQLEVSANNRSEELSNQIFDKIKSEYENVKTALNQELEESKKQLKKVS
ncbi:MAG: response regulator [Pseudomonadota bacterium]